MTGATGFLGHFVLAELLARGRRVVVMVRPPLTASRDRLAVMMRRLDLDLHACLEQDRLVLVEGALPAALPDADWGSTDDLLLCAASLQLFANGNEEPYETNVAGTEASRDWARRQGVKRIHAVSTAYVCGSRTECVREAFHHPRPEFGTDYEKSKWLAESLLARWRDEPGNVLSVFRPSFLVGDSSSGYTTQYGGFYQLARMVSILKDRFRDGTNGAPTRVPLRIPGRPDDPQNFVPVDFAARIIAEVVLDSALHGRVYHLTDPTPPTNRDIKRGMEDYFRLHGGHFVDPAEMVGDLSLAESLVYENYEVVTPRITHNPRFDQRNTDEVMRVKGIAFPSLTRERFNTLLDYAVASRWGKRTNGAVAGKVRRLGSDRNTDIS